MVSKKNKKPIWLNLGSGPGRYDGYSNVDLDPANKPDYVCGVEELPFKDGKVERIFASHVLEHVKYDVDVIKEWARVLAPGGVLIVAVPDIVQMLGLQQAGLVSLEYLHCTVYGSAMCGHIKGHRFEGHSPKYMTHHRIYSPMTLVQEMVRHLTRIVVGPGDMPRQGTMGECVVRGWKS